MALIDDNKKRGLEVPLPEGTGAVSITEEIYNKYKKIIDESEKAGVKIDQAQAQLTPNSISLKAAITAISNIFNGKIFKNNPITNDIVKTLSNGISRAKANELFAQDISRSEQSIKQLMKSLGLKKMPQNVFDGLVSFHNQVGNISYAYVNGEKIDLTSLYATQQWDRAASFIALDERDRERRLKEASIMAFNSYGPAVNIDTVVNQGLEKLQELINKELLNEQTGEPADAQQLLAASNVYYDEVGEFLPGVAFEFQARVVNEELAKAVQEKQVGPWPY